jgi:hypothetical protein
MNLSLEHIHNSYTISFRVAVVNTPGKEGRRAPSARSPATAIIRLRQKLIHKCSKVVATITALGAPLPLELRHPLATPPPPPPPD